jgi:Na+-translocating ferredoxin:NAD+ oxidoreductase RnfC subunit
MRKQNKWTDEDVKTLINKINESGVVAYTGKDMSKIQKQRKKIKNARRKKIITRCIITAYKICK